MKKFYLPAAGLAAALIGTTSCVDDNYNINDANTLSRISINDLTVPLNLDKIYLDSIVDLTDGTNVEKFKDSATGKEYYVLTEKGSVNSDPIEINPISAAKADIDNSVIPLQQSGNAGDYTMVAVASPFTYMSVNVDPAVQSVEGLQAVNPVKISMKLSLPASAGITKTSMEDISLVFPKGLLNTDGSAAKANIGTYDPVSGLLTVSACDFPDGLNAEFYVTCDAFSFNDYAVSIDNARTLTLKGEMGTSANGRIKCVASAGASLPSTLALTADYTLEGFDVRNFTGQIDYEVMNTALDPIHLDDLPDFLQDPETKMVISDPQFYFAVQNPTAKYGTSGFGHISMSSDFINNPTYSSNGPELTILAEPVTHICVSADGNVANPLPAYKENLMQYKYPEMRYILSGDPSEEAGGLPTEINVAFDNQRFVGHALRFPVRNNRYNELIGSMSGEYEFFAPLAFDENSVIVYRESTNISGDDSKDVYVEYLKVKADGVSSFPVSVTLSAVAYDIYGVQVGKSNAQEIPALSEMPVDLKIEATTPEGVMNRVDRIDFRAYILQTATGAGEALAPDQGLLLDNLKITLSGYYEKKF